MTDAATNVMLHSFPKEIQVTVPMDRPGLYVKADDYKALEKQFSDVIKLSQHWRHTQACPANNCPVDPNPCECGLDKARNTRIASY